MSIITLLCYFVVGLQALPHATHWSEKTFVNPDGSVVDHSFSAVIAPDARLLTDLGDDLLLSCGHAEGEVELTGPSRHLVAEELEGKYLALGHKQHNCDSDVGEPLYVRVTKIREVRRLGLDQTTLSLTTEKARLSHLFHDMNVKTTYYPASHPMNPYPNAKAQKAEMEKEVERRLAEDTELRLSDPTYSREKRELLFINCIFFPCNINWDYNMGPGWNWNQATQSAEEEKIPIFSLSGTDAKKSEEYSVSGKGSANLTCVECYVVLKFGFTFEMHTTRKMFGLPKMPLLKFSVFGEIGVSIDLLLEANGKLKLSKDIPLTGKGYKLPGLSLLEGGIPFWIKPNTWGVKLSLELELEAELTMNAGAFYNWNATWGVRYTEQNGWKTHHTMFQEYGIYQPVVAVEGTSSLTVGLMPYMKFITESMLPISFSLEPYVKAEATWGAGVGSLAPTYPCPYNQVQLNLSYGINFIIEIEEVNFLVVKIGSPWLSHEIEIEVLEAIPFPGKWGSQCLGKADPSNQSHWRPNNDGSFKIILDEQIWSSANPKCSGKTDCNSCLNEPGCEWCYSVENSFSNAGVCGSSLPDNKGNVNFTCPYPGWMASTNCTRPLNFTLQELTGHLPLTPGEVFNLSWYGGGNNVSFFMGWARQNTNYFSEAFGLPTWAINQQYILYTPDLPFGVFWQPNKATAPMTYELFPELPVQIIIGDGITQSAMNATAFQNGDDIANPLWGVSEWGQCSMECDATAYQPTEPLGWGYRHFTCYKQSGGTGTSGEPEWGILNGEALAAYPTGCGSSYPSYTQRECNRDPCVYTNMSVSISNLTKGTTEEEELGMLPPTFPVWPNNTNMSSPFSQYEIGQQVTLYWTGGLAYQVYRIEYTRVAPGEKPSPKAVWTACNGGAKYQNTNGVNDTFVWDTSTVKDAGMYVLQFVLLDQNGVEQTNHLTQQILLWKQTIYPITKTISQSSANSVYNLAGMELSITGTFYLQAEMELPESVSTVSQRSSLSSPSLWQCDSVTIEQTGTYAKPVAVISAEGFENGKCPMRANTQLVLQPNIAKALTTHTDVSYPECCALCAVSKECEIFQYYLGKEDTYDKYGGECKLYTDAMVLTTVKAVGYMIGFKTNTCEVVLPENFEGPAEFQPCEQITSCFTCNNAEHCVWCDSFSQCTSSVPFNETNTLIPSTSSGNFIASGRIKTPAHGLSAVPEYTCLTTVSDGSSYDLTSEPVECAISSLGMQWMFWKPGYTQADSNGRRQLRSGRQRARGRGGEHETTRQRSPRRGDTKTDTEQEPIETKEQNSKTKIEERETRTGDQGVNGDQRVTMLCSLSVFEEGGVDANGGTCNGCNDDGYELCLWVDEKLPDCFYSYLNFGTSPIGETTTEGPVICQQKCHEFTGGCTNFTFQANIPSGETNCRFFGPSATPDLASIFYISGPAQCGTNTCAVPDVVFAQVGNLGFQISNNLERQGMHTADFHYGYSEEWISTDNTLKPAFGSTANTAGECYEICTTTPGCIAATFTSSPGTGGGTCIADHGTAVGYPVCCGIGNVVEKGQEAYICPATAPVCSGYSDTSYGKCGGNSLTTGTCTLLSSITGYPSEDSSSTLIIDDTCTIYRKGFTIVSDTTTKTTTGVSSLDNCAFMCESDVSCGAFIYYGEGDEKAQECIMMQSGVVAPIASSSTHTASHAGTCSRTGDGGKGSPWVCAQEGGFCDCDGGTTFFGPAETQAQLLPATDECQFMITSTPSSYGDAVVSSWKGDCSATFSQYNIPDSQEGGTCQSRYGLLNGMLGVTVPGSSIVAIDNLSCDNQEFTIDATSSICPAGWSVTAATSCISNGASVVTGNAALTNGATCCITGYTSECDQGCAEDACSIVGGLWISLDYSYNSYTCLVGKNWNYLQSDSSSGSGALVACGSSNQLLCKSPSGDDSGCQWGGWSTSYSLYEAVSDGPNENYATFAANCPAWAAEDGSDACAVLGCYAPSDTDYGIHGPSLSFNAMVATNTAVTTSGSGQCTGSKAFSGTGQCYCVPPDVPLAPGVSSLIVQGPQGSGWLGSTSVTGNLLLGQTSTAEECLSLCQLNQANFPGTTACAYQCNGCWLGDFSPQSKASNAACFQQAIPLQPSSTTAAAAPGSLLATPAVTATKCADQGADCTCSGTVYYGTGNGVSFGTLKLSPFYAQQFVTSTVPCDASSFGATYTGFSNYNGATLLSDASTTEQRCFYRYISLADAQRACSANLDCTLITQDDGLPCGPDSRTYTFELRTGGMTHWNGMLTWIKSSPSEIVANPGQCYCVATSVGNTPNLPEPTSGEWQACQQQCAEITTCKSFTYYDSKCTLNQEFYKKSNAIEVPGAMSGPPSCLSVSTKATSMQQSYSDQANQWKMSVGDSLTSEIESVLVPGHCLAFPGMDSAAELVPCSSSSSVTSKKGAIFELNNPTLAIDGYKVLSCPNSESLFDKVPCVGSCPSPSFDPAANDCVCEMNWIQCVYGCTCTTLDDTVTSFIPLPECNLEDDEFAVDITIIDGAIRCEFASDSRILKFGGSNSLITQDDYLLGNNADGEQFYPASSATATAPRTQERMAELCSTSKESVEFSKTFNHDQLSDLDPETTMPDVYCEGKTMVEEIVNGVPTSVNRNVFITQVHYEFRPGTLSETVCVEKDLLTEIRLGNKAVTVSCYDRDQIFNTGRVRTTVLHPQGPTPLTPFPTASPTGNPVPGSCLRRCGSPARKRLSPYIYRDEVEIEEDTNTTEEESKWGFFPPMPMMGGAFRPNFFNPFVPTFGFHQFSQPFFGPIAPWARPYLPPPPPPPPFRPIGPYPPPPPPIMYECGCDLMCEQYNDCCANFKYYCHL